MRNTLRTIALLGLIPMAGACASASAKGKAADRPAMNVPPPPPRVIEPTPEPPPEPVGDLPSASGTSSPRPGRPESRSASPKPEASKATEAKAGEAAPAEATPPVAASPPGTPPPQLRTPQTADTDGAARNVQATVERANTMLGGVDYGPLSNNRKKAYNDAKRFIRQAEDALKRGNFAFAQGVATKAETLARELSGK
jgi:hypothetical protein